MTKFKIGITKTDSIYINVERSSKDFVEDKKEILYIVNFLSESVPLIREAKDANNGPVFYEGWCDKEELSIIGITRNGVLITEGPEFDAEIGWIGIKKT